MKHKTEEQIKNILLYYFDEDNLDEYLEYYESIFANVNETVYAEIVKLIGKSLFEVDPDTIYFLTFALKQTLVEDAKRETTAEHNFSKSQLKSIPRLAGLLMKLQKKKSEKIKIIVKVDSKEFEFEEQKLIDDLKVYVEKTLRDRVADELSPEFLKYLAEDPLEPITSKKHEPDDDYFTLREFAFCVFKYLADDKIFDPKAVREIIVTEHEDKKELKIDHLRFIAELYHLAGAELEDRAEHSENTTSIYDFNNEKMNHYFFEKIRRHIRDHRDWLRDEFRSIHPPKE